MTRKLLRELLNHTELVDEVVNDILPKALETEVYPSNEHFNIVTQNDSRCELFSETNSTNSSTTNLSLSRNVPCAVTKGQGKLLRMLHFVQQEAKQRLLTTPEEKQRHKTYLRELSVKDEASQIQIAKLKAELEKAEEHMNSEINKKNDIIRKLEAEFKNIENFSAEKVRTMKRESEKQRNMEEKNSEGRQAKLKAELATTRKKYENLVNADRENEKELRDLRFKKELEVETKIGQFDQDIGEIQKEFEMLDAEYSLENRELTELEEKFEVLEVEYQAIMEERRLNEEREQAAEAQRQAVIAAAVTIQAFWRSYKTRKVNRGKKRGGKSGKK